MTLTRNTLLAACLFFTAAAQCQTSADTGKVVGPGVTWSHEFLPAGPLNYNIMRVDLDNPRVTLEMESGKDRLFAGEKVLSSVKRESETEDVKVIGAVNADFWSYSPKNFWPVGLLVADGMIYNMPAKSRSAFVLTDNERPFIGPVSLNVTLADQMNSFKIDRINSGTGSDEEIVLFTPPYGETVPPAPGRRFVLETASREFLPNKPLSVKLAEVDSKTSTTLGEKRFVLHVPTGRTETIWFESGRNAVLRAHMPQVDGVVTSVCGGGPTIVEEGKVHIPLDEENIPDSFSETKHPRTALGFTKDRETIYLVTVDGRQPRISVGASLEELAAYMVKLGCWEAINLDGGGSTTMVVNGKVVNNPSDFTGPRTVANSLLVVASDGAGEPATLSFEPQGMPLVVPVGASVKIAVSALDENAIPVDLPDSTAIKVASGGIVESAEVTGNVVDLTFSEEPSKEIVKFMAGSADGSLSVQTVEVEKILTEPETLVIGSGDKTEIHVTAMANGEHLNLTPEMVELSSADSRIVTVEEAVAVGESSGASAINIRIGEAKADIPVYVDRARHVSIEDFDAPENLGPIEGTVFDKEATAATLEKSNVKEGEAAARLEYKMEKGGRTRINLPMGHKISEKPAGFSIWVYGDGKEAWVRANLVDSNGVLFIADFTNGADGITWKDEWKHLMVSYESLIGTDFDKSPRPVLPLTVRELVIAQDQEALKKSGIILLDDFNAVYPPE